MADWTLPELLGMQPRLTGDSWRDHDCGGFTERVLSTRIEGGGHLTIDRCRRCGYEQMWEKRPREESGGVWYWRPHRHAEWRICESDANLARVTDG